MSKDFKYISLILIKVFRAVRIFFNLFPRKILKHQLRVVGRKITYNFLNLPCFLLYYYVGPIESQARLSGNVQ